MQLRAFLALTVLVALHSTPPEAASIGQFRVGAWQAAAHLDDKTRAFSHCSAFVPYRSGIVLFVAIDRASSWRLGFSHSSWRLKLGQQIPVALTFDGAGPVSVTALARTATFATIEMPYDSALIRSFRVAHRLDAYTAGEKFSFSLDGTARLLPALAQCVQRHVKPAVATSQPRRPSAQPPSVNPDTERERAKLLQEAAAEHDKCMSQQMRTIVPYSNEAASTLAQVIITNCASAEEKFTNLGVALLNTPREEVQRVVREHLEQRKRNMVAEIVTFRAELTRALANQPKKDDPGKDVKAFSGI